MKHSKPHLQCKTTDKLYSKIRIDLFSVARAYIYYSLYAYKDCYQTCINVIILELCHFLLAVLGKLLFGVLFRISEMKRKRKSAIMFHSSAITFIDLFLMGQCTSHSGKMYEMGVKLRHHVTHLQVSVHQQLLYEAHLPIFKNGLI